MAKERVVSPSAEFKKNANINLKDYKSLYKESIENPNKFWAREANRLTWFKKWTKVLSHDFKNAKVE
ncbi:PF11930 domain protein [Leptospira kirschneri serovar Mozdok]|nr:PF11930 domain protein [Leptospira kirschneri serovar Mozdok]